MGKSKKKDWDDEDDEPQKDKDHWKVIRDLLSFFIVKNDDWVTAQIIADQTELIQMFSDQFPDTYFSLDDTKTALYDLGIAYERNEHNNKFYYLADWK